jgi:hypothetical protein
MPSFSELGAKSALRHTAGWLYRGPERHHRLSLAEIASRWREGSGGTFRLPCSVRTMGR